MSGQKTAYFGPELLRKGWERQVPAPVGEQCLLCDDVVQTDDIGTINFIGQITHYECQMRAVVGSLGHQMRRCSCYGGNEEDPDGMTVREAAIAATRYHHGERQ